MDKDKLCERKIVELKGQILNSGVNQHVTQ